ncbi:MAG: tape measure protein [Candidatus Onthovivens sp.]|nr:tape measure protein [Candidatus Onthovivens sp.]
MSTTIDEKVVSLEFDNRRFERNVKTSIGTINKLKKSLDFEENSKSLEHVGKAANNVNMSTLSKNIDTVKTKFSSLQVIAITALANITNSAVNAGKRLIASLSTDQLIAGWTKYEEKTASIQTIMNSTGKSIDEVSGYLDKLMWFSDETSYSFTDMTKSLAQLTSAGGDVDKLIPMIEGIANATAFAGKGVNEFNRAIYNLNQSYSAGYLQYMDWKSLDMAGVSSKQLKQALIDAGVELGKIAEGEVTIENFAQSLSDRWADTSVMEKAFGKFAELTEAAYEAVQAGEYETAAEAIEALSADYDELGVKAFKAAQEAKSFSEAINAVKDAVSSSWLKTYEIVFGNYEQAKEVWGGLYESLWEIFASGAENRNKVLSEALSKSGWQKFLDQGIIDEENYISILNKTAKQHGIDIEQIIEDEGSLQKAIAKGKIPLSLLTIALNDLTNAYEYLDDETLKNMGFTKAQVEQLRKLNENVQNGTVYLGDFVDEIDKVSGRDLLIESFSNILNSLVTVINSVKSGFSDIFGLETGKLYETIKSFNEFTKSLVISEETADKLRNTFAGLFAVIDIVLYITKSVLKVLYEVLKSLSFINEGILDVSGGIGSFLVALRNAIKGSEKFENILNGLKNILIGLINILKGVITTLASILGKSLYIIINIFKEIYYFIKKFISSETFINIINGIKNVLISFVNATTELLKSLLKLIKVVVSKIVSILKTLWNFLTSIFDIKNITKILTIIKNAIISFVDVVSNVFKRLFGSLSGFANIIKSIFVSIWNFIKSIYEKIKNVIDNIVGKFKSGSTNIVDIVSSVLAGGALVAIGYALIKFSMWLADIIRSMKGPITAFGEILDELRDTINSFTRSINVRSIKNIALSILTIVASLLLLTFIDYDKLMNALAALTVLFIELAVMYNVMMSTIESLDIKTLDQAKIIVKTIKTINTIASSLLLLVIPLTILSLIPWDNLSSALASITILIVTLVASFKIISKSLKELDEKQYNSGFINNTYANIYKMCKALTMLAIPLALLSLTDWQKSWPVLIAISGTIVLLGLISKITYKTGKETQDKKQKNTIAHLAGLCAALSLLAISLGYLAIICSNLPSNDIWESFGYLAGSIVILGAIALILQNLKKINGDIDKSAKSIAILAMSLIPIVIALKMLSTTSWDGIYKSLSGLILVFTALYGLIGALFLLTKIENSLDDNLKSLKNNIKVLYKIMFMLIALTIPIKILSTIKWNELSKAIVSMLSVLTLLIGALKIISLISSGSGGSEHVSILSGIATSIKTIATALVLASSCILIFAAALYILSKIDSEKIADVLLAFVKVIPAILQTIIDYLPLIAKVILAAISMLIEVVIGAIPLIVSALMTLILNVLSSLAEHAYEIGVYLLRIILGILDALSEFIPDILTKLHEIILKINQAIIEFIPKLIIDIFTLVAKVFRALVDSIILLVQEIIDSVKEINSEMFLELIEAIGLISILLTELSLVVMLLPSGIAGAIGLISFLPYIAAIYSLIGSINLIPLEINLQIWKDILDSINYISEIMLAIIPSIALLPSAILGALALVTFLGFLAGIYSLMGAINLIPLRIDVQIWKDILDSIVYILEIMLALIPYIALVRFGELGALCLIDFLTYLTPTLALLSLITSLGLSIDTKVLTDFANALKPVIAICIEFSSLLPFATLGKVGAIAFITFIPFLLVVAECIKEVCNILTKDVMNIKSETFREFSEILEYIIKICIEISAMLVLATLGKAGAIAFITFIPLLLVVAECIKLLYIVLTKNSINSEPFKAFIEILGYVALICIEIIGISALASIATASTGAIFIFMAGLNILILWLYSLQKIINNLSTKSFMNFATILGALLLICTEISILMPFAVLGFYGTIMLNTLLPSLMLTGVFLKGLQSAINGFDSNIFMTFANVLGALLLICMALTTILPFAVIGTYGTFAINAMIPSLMLAADFIKGLYEILIADTMTMNSKPFMAFANVLGALILICMALTTILPFAVIGTYGAFAINAMIPSLMLAAGFIKGLYEILIANTMTMDSKPFMAFANVLGALLLICMALTTILPFAVLGFYGTIMLNTLLPSLMLTGVFLKGLQSAINGLNSNIFMAFANVLGALLLTCMALTTILPFAVLGFYGTIMLNTLLPSLMLTGVFLKGLQLSVNGLDSNIFIEFYEVLKICKQIFSILNGLSFNLFGALIAINNLKILLPKLGTVLSNFSTLFSTDSKDSVNNIKILCEAIDNLIDILNKAKTKNFGNAKKLTDQLFDFYKKVNKMEIPQFDVISKFEDYAKSIRICLDLYKDIPDNYSNDKIENLTIFIENMFDCLSNLYLLLNIEIPQFDAISKFEDYAKSIRICVDSFKDISKDIPDNYSNDKIKNLIFFIEDIFDCLSNLYLLLNKDLDKNIFNTIKMDTSKFKKMIIDLSSVVNELVYMYSNIQNNLDENKLSTILDTLFNSLQRFIDNVNSLDGIDKATEKLKSLKDCLKIAMEIAQNDIGNYTPTIRPVVDLNGVRNGIRNMNNMFDINPYVGLSTNSANQINSMMNANLNNSNNDLISLVRDINNKMDNDSGDVYNINGITYDDGSAVQDAIKTILRAAKIQGRI